jgi:hypothetical protein
VGQHGREGGLNPAPRRINKATSEQAAVARAFAAAADSAVALGVKKLDLGGSRGRGLQRSHAGAAVNALQADGRALLESGREVAFELSRLSLGGSREREGQRSLDAAKPAGSQEDTEGGPGATDGAVALGMMNLHLGGSRGREEQRSAAGAEVGSWPVVAEPADSQRDAEGGQGDAEGGAAESCVAERSAAPAAATLSDAACADGKGDADGVEDAREAWVGPVWHERRARHVWVHPTTGEIRLLPVA